MSCSHELDADYLYPGDVGVMEVYDDGGLRITLAVACPDCGQALELDVAVDSVEEGEFELPLDDELYD